MINAEIHPQPLGSLQVNDTRGTFKDGLKAPIHRWFPYPVGFSPELVKALIEEAKLPEGARFYDPFAGTATSLITARRAGLEAHGIENHPFIQFVGATKLRWDIPGGLAGRAEALIEAATAAATPNVGPEEGTVPTLLWRCFEPIQLRRMLAIRGCVFAAGERGTDIRDLGELALAAIARPAANVSTKWPYIAPKRKRILAVKDATTLFSVQLRRMVADLATVAYRRDWPAAELLSADARAPHPTLEPGSVDLVVTSMPYLNNFDYADRTRLETYLLGQYATWTELTVQVRRKLVMAATPHLDRLKVTTNQLLAPVFALDAALGTELQELVDRIQCARTAQKGDKKFHLVAAGYFGDIAQALIHLRRSSLPVPPCSVCSATPHSSVCMCRQTSWLGG